MMNLVTEIDLVGCRRRWLDLVDVIGDETGASVRLIPETGHHLLGPMMPSGETGVLDVGRVLGAGCPLETFGKTERIQLGSAGRARLWCPAGPPPLLMMFSTSVSLISGFLPRPFHCFTFCGNWWRSFEDLFDHARPRRIRSAGLTPALDPVSQRWKKAATSRRIGNRTRPDDKSGSPRKTCSSGSRRHRGADHCPSSTAPTPAAGTKESGWRPSR